MWKKLHFITCMKVLSNESAEVTCMISEEAAPRTSAAPLHLCDPHLQLSLLPPPHPPPLLLPLLHPSHHKGMWWPFCPSLSSTLLSLPTFRMRSPPQSIRRQICRSHMTAEGKKGFCCTLSPWQSVVGEKVLILNLIMQSWRVTNGKGQMEAVGVLIIVWLKENLIHFDALKCVLSELFISSRSLEISLVYILL